MRLAYPPLAVSSLPPNDQRSSDLALRSSGHGATRPAHETAPRGQLAGMRQRAGLSPDVAPGGRRFRGVHDQWFP